MKIVSIAVSKTKGVRKTQVEKARLLEDYGVEGDGHAGDPIRQVSFLSAESIKQAAEQGLEVGFGDFAENIATSGIEWLKVPLGTRIALGDSAVVEITKIGKECHKKCAIYYKAGDCIMPREGVFGRVVKGGDIYCGDKLAINYSPPLKS